MHLKKCINFSSKIITSVSLAEDGRYRRRTETNQSVKGAFPELIVKIMTREGSALIRRIPVLGNDELKMYIDNKREKIDS